MLVTIEKLIYGGEGLAHHEGQTLFVPFVLPGEAVEFEPIERKKKFLRGRARRVVTPAPERLAPACRHFTDCGGCHYQHIPYEVQLRFKTEILRETLRRVGRIAWDGPITVHPSPPWGYRNRAQWKVRPAASGNSALAIGYFRASSNAICAVEECPIISPRLAETLTALREALAKGQFPASLREIEAFVDASDSKLLLNASFANFSASPSSLAEIFRRIVPCLESLLLIDTSRDRMELDGPGFLRYEAAGTSYRVGHMSFFQVNRFLVEEMAQAVARAAQGGGKLALDLYAGVGLFTLPLARQFARVVAVEANPASVRDLMDNIASARGVVEACESDVEPLLRGWKDTPDFVVLDPPRPGAAPTALASLTKLAPPRIAYVSCDPSTLARDLAMLIASGYSLEEMNLFDLFPETFHIESFALLSRGALPPLSLPSAV
jgi:23S rRNA (uracil1939-C5)-methyltransferase